MHESPRLSRARPLRAPLARSSQNRVRGADAPAGKPCLMRFWTRSLVIAFAAAVLAPATASATSRIKDLADVEGVRDNLLVGYGLVVGLDGTGDRIRNTPFTRESLVSMLERLGVNIRSELLDTDNIAAVMVTSNLPAFATQGARIDVSVSALGDAESLRGGVLLVTPLQGANGEVYAVAQGPVAVSGFGVRGQAASITRGVPTNGRIANGAVVEREIDYRLGEQTSVRLALRNPDFTTARRIAEAVERTQGKGVARVVDPGTVRIERPGAYPGDMVALIGAIENLAVDPDQAARVVIDEASGVIVMGDDVRISTVAIAQGPLTISVSETPQASQPSPFSRRGDTVVLPRTEVTADDGEGELRIVSEGVRLADLVEGLNALGVSPRDMISILQAIKTSGALQADIEVM
jgi:flagellar P-ring protein precursor FlgI